MKSQVLCIACQADLRCAELVIMDCASNRFVQRKLERLFGIERDIIRLYAEACYANIQGACGNQSCVERMQELNHAIGDAYAALSAIKMDLRRLGVPRKDMISLDDLQKLDIFEAQFKQHDGGFGRGQLSDMLEDIASFKD